MLVHHCCQLLKSPGIIQTHEMPLVVRPLPLDVVILRGTYRHQSFLVNVELWRHVKMTKKPSAINEDALTPIVVFSRASSGQRVSPSQ